VDPAAQELLRETGCDRIVCPTRFEALVVSHELLNPGAREILEELLSGTRGHQLNLTAVDAAASPCLGQLAGVCAAHGRTALGGQRGTQSTLSQSPEHEVRPGVRLVSIGAARLPAKALR
jgi:hypothetical protein